MHDDSAHDRPAPPVGAHRPDDGRSDDNGFEVVVETVKHGIDQVADKVKGLLRSGR